MFIPINKVSEYLKVIKNCQPKRIIIELTIEELTVEQMSVFMGGETKDINEKVKLIKD